jgi:ABC-type sugar transport system ATPase subunit
MKTPILEVKNLVKTYGRVIALDGANLELFPGEVLAIVGDNGAGKSTLIKCITGAESADSGTIHLNGIKSNFEKVQDSRLAGIETVYQTLAVAPALDVTSNIFLGREIRMSGILGAITRKMDTSKMESEAKKHIASLGIDQPPQYMHIHLADISQTCAERGANIADTRRLIQTAARLLVVESRRVLAVGDHGAVAVLEARATSVCGLKLLVYAVLSYWCMRR